MTNPYIERGIVPSEREMEILLEALGGVARFFESKGMKDDQALAVDMIRRYQQVANAGTGLTDDVLMRYHKRIFTALRQGNMPAFKQAYGDMFATAIRLAPDPAEQVGMLLTQIVLTVQATKALEMAAGPLLGRVKIEIDACREDIAAERWDPDQDVLAYLSEWLEVGYGNAVRGLEPWPDGDTPADPSDGPAPT